MYISEVKIKNFKAFKQLSFKCNKDFNVIIGENNIGKSTLFEAILLWEHCFKTTINAKKTGFYKADGKNSYIPFNDLSFLRLINDTDLFFESPNTTRITLVICDRNETFSLAFDIDKPKSISNSYLRYKTFGQREFENFSLFMRRKKITLDKAIFIYQTKPVSNILHREPFMNKAQILSRISVGKSGEVLRNKIVSKKGMHRTSIEQQITNVLGYDITFDCKNEGKADSEEFIALHVNGRDIHLQGSGVLQIAEIFSTIEYLENAMNILLIDEPDSHIHSKLQKSLLTELRKITNTQTFIISHNDNFVNELKPQELFYLNQVAKDHGEINQLDFDNFDKIKKDLGGVIMALDKLNYADRICFVEGDDDINYIELAKNRLQKIDQNFNTPLNLAFYFLRGKDNLLNKIDYHKRFMSQLFRDKAISVIYDKDFSTEQNSILLNQAITRKLGRNSDSYYHDGYCIESILFTDLNVLSDFLSSYYSTNNLRTDLFINEYIQNIEIQFNSITSDLYGTFETKFKGQQNGSRPDLEAMQFNDFIRDSLTPTFKKQYFFNKFLIKNFIEEYAKNFGISFEADDKTDEYYSSSLFKSYIEWIPDTSKVYPALHNLITKVYN